MWLQLIYTQQHLYITCSPFLAFHTNTYRTCECWRQPCWATRRKTQKEEMDRKADEEQWKTEEEKNENTGDCVAVITFAVFMLGA